MLKLSCSDLITEKIKNINRSIRFVSITKASPIICTEQEHTRSPSMNTFIVDRLIQWSLSENDMNSDSFILFLRRTIIMQYSQCLERSDPPMIDHVT